MRSNDRKGIRKYIFVAVSSALMLILGMTPISSAANAAPPAASSDEEFAAQARSVGLSDAQAKELQATVDEYMTKTGGVQVAVNKIQVPGADIYVVIPGEEVARDISVQAPISACQYQHMCAYSGVNFTGSIIDMYSCGIYSIPWVGNGSWDNNQTTGSRAQFRDINGNVGYTSPGAHSLDLNAPWGWVYSIRNC